MYTDPGIVSMVVAAAVGAVIAVPVYLAIYRKKIGDWLKRRKDDKRPGEL
jgi:hypothetical protein